MHGGKLAKGSLLAFLNPFSAAWKNAKRAKAAGTVRDSNLNGDGLTLGGACGQGACGEGLHCSSAGKVFASLPQHACAHAPLCMPAGLLIIKRGGEVAYAYPEKTFGDHAPHEEVLAAARAVGGGQ